MSTALKNARLPMTGVNRQMGGRYGRNEAVLTAQLLEDGHLQRAGKAPRAGRDGAIALQEGSPPVEVEVEGGRGGGFDPEEGLRSDIHP